MCTNRPDKLKIDKLYIHCDYHHKGYGALLVTDAIDIMQGNNFQLLILAVNKRNEKAIGSYRKYGFVVRESIVDDIGHGFVMDDYVMEKKL